MIKWVGNTWHFTTWTITHRPHALARAFWSIFRLPTSWAYRSWGAITFLMNRIPVRTDVNDHGGHEYLMYLTYANHTPKYLKNQLTFLNRCFLCNVKVIIWKGKIQLLDLYDKKRYNETLKKIKFHIPFNL